MRYGLPFAAALLGSVVLTVSPAGADPILAADPALDALAASYERQQDTFARAESGQNLDAFIKPADIQTVKDFFAQGQPFQTFAGKHPFDVVESFDEHGDMGNFSGIASVGLAARLMVLKRDSAAAAEITRARDACVRAARTWHVFATIGGPGIVARGVRRVTPLAGEPALPGTTPALVPLKDGMGAPLPSSKTDTWRAPVASGFDGWIWVDNTSKDQLSGYALGVLWLWDALRTDPAAPKDVVDALVTDIVSFAKELMKIKSGPNVDLVAHDADGRATSFGDLNSRLVDGSGGIVLGANSSIQNGFNAALAMGIIRAAHRMSGDAVLKKYYEDDLVTTREYPRHAADTAALLFLGEGTNFSNANMLAIALATLGRIETVPAVRARLTQLIDKFWDSGNNRSAKYAKQPWFDVIVAGFGGSARPEVPARMHDALVAYPAVPTMQRDVVNCDAGEIAALSCLAVDGVTTIPLSSTKGRGGSIVSTMSVPVAVRPDTNFAWRSDPFGVNDGASNRLNPRGDWLAAYWLGKLLDKDPSKNLIAPDVVPPVVGPDAGTGTSGGVGGDGGTGTSGGVTPPDDGVAPSSPDSGGCGCIVEGRGTRAAELFGLAGIAALAAVARRRRRAR
jgi:hypothetical protein